MGSPLPTLAILGVYLTLIALGPRAMASRPAFELRLPMFVYNVLVCLLNGWMAIEVGPSYRLQCRWELTRIFMKSIT